MNRQHQSIPFPGDDVPRHGSLAERGRLETSPRIARPALPFVICLLLVGSTVAWRRDTFFAGSFDPVVIIKALLSVAALGAATIALVRSPRRRPVGAVTLTLLTAYLLVALLGAWAAGNGFASLVITVRMVILATTISAAIAAYPSRVIIASLARVMTLAALVAAVSGGATLADGRLSGGIPPLASNGLAFLCGFPILALVWRAMRSEGHWYDWPMVALLLSIIWLTESRTSLAALILGIIVIVLQSRRLSPPFFLGIVALIPVGTYLVVGTAAITGLFARGGEQNITTLSSRTIAWSAALNLPGWWQHWFGGGLSIVEVPVTGQYWAAQVLDSTWLSAVVQSGALGTALCAIWIMWMVTGALKQSNGTRVFLTGVLAYLLPRSILETGLFGATPDFVIIMMISLMCEATTRDRHAVAPACQGELGPAARSKSVLAGRDSG